MAGVDSTGFVQKTVAEIIASIEAGYKTVYGAAVDVSASSRIGQRIQLFAGALSEVWELGETLYNSFDPDISQGLLLDSLMKLAGLSRKEATASTVDLLLVSDSGSITIPAGKVVGVPTTSAQFAIDSDALLDDVPWNPGTYAVGDLVSNDSPENIYVCTTAGTSVTGPLGEDADITDGGTAHWAFAIDGRFFVVAAATSVVTGAVQGPADSVTEIETPVSGWTGATNLADAMVGQDAETDFEARNRRAKSFGRGGLNSIAAVRAAVLAVDGVSSCTIFENDTDETLDSVPAHAFEALVEGGQDQDIIDAIFARRPAGIRPYGTTAGSAVNSNGDTHTIGFSRPTAVPIYVAVTLTYEAASYPGDGDDQVRAAIVDAGSARPVGRNVVSNQIAADIWAALSGLDDVSSVFIGTAPSPATSTTIAVTPRQRATFDVSRVSVASSVGDP